MLRSMAANPIVFAMANPDPEIIPEDAKAVRGDVIIATGRSDYPNQVNNVLGFPYIFRGALDVRATTINEEMKIACAEAIAALAREDVPDEVAAAYRGARPVYGPDYIIPVPFDPRLIARVSAAVARAAMESGVAKKPIMDMIGYQYELSARLDPSAGLFQMVTNAVRAAPRRVVFAEGEEDSVIRAAAAFQNSGLGKAILVGRPDVVKAGMKRAGLDEKLLEIRVPHSAEDAAPYIEALYKRIQRRGALYRDAVRMVTNDRKIYDASMLKAGDADALVTGVTRNYADALAGVRQVLDPPPGKRPMGMQAIFARGRVVLIADTSVTEMPTSEQLADIAIQAAAAARRFGLTPRVALLASTSFGFPRSERSERIIEAVQILEARGVDFEYDGEMAVDVALDREKLALYPFARITDTANVLIMPAIHSASISTRLLQQMGHASVMGPMLVGLEKPVQIAPLGARMSEIYNAAMVAAYDINR
jgi:malate dehydrogenase (oxaloacetate-decarboxylating)(NADP+)